MNGDTDQIANCESCSCQMDVSVLAPFTNVQCPECGAQTRVKCELDQYILRRRQGVGGMSLVFAAKDKNLGREVAIKILNEDYSSDATRITQFEQEAMITAGISHPNVVRVYTVGKAFNRYYIAMELVTGQSMEQIMGERGALPETEIIPKMRQVTEGLYAAYKVGLIHRDIKPGNILIDNLNMAKIVDFGLALVTQGGVATAEEIWATPYYVPPEALEGQPEDFRSDVYALSATMYHALAGKPPFSAETRNTRELAEIKKSIPSLKIVAPWLSDSICAVIDKGMKYSPQERFASYEEMVHAVQYAEDSIGVEGASLPVHGAARAARATGGLPAKYKIIIPLVLGVVILAIGGFFIIKAVMGDRPNEDPSETTGSGNTDNSTALFDEELRNKIDLGFAEIHAYVKYKNFKKAHEATVSLQELPKHPEPSATVVALHRIIHKYLDGKPRQARHIMLELIKRSSTVKYDKKAGFKKDDIQRVLRSLNSLSPTSLKETRIGSNEAASLLASLAAALKNSEQGHWELAKSQLEKVRNFNNKRTGKHANVFNEYKKIAADYLYDIQAMERARGAQISEMNKETIASHLNTLRSIKLKTQMQRAPWLLEIQIKNCDSAIELIIEREKQTTVHTDPPPPPNEVTFAKEKEKLANAIAKRDFKFIIGVMENLKFKNYRDEEKRKKYKDIIQSAENFFQNFSASMEGKRINKKIADSEGKEYEIEIFKDTGVQVSKNGRPYVITWGNIDPRSLLNLYPELTNGLADFQKNIILENAAWYAFATSQNDLAANASKRLAANNSIFKTRWEAAMLILKE